MVMTMKITTIWDVMQCSVIDCTSFSEEPAPSIFYLEDGGTRFLQIVYNDLADYMVPHLNLHVKVRVVLIICFIFFSDYICLYAWCVNRVHLHDVSFATVDLCMYGWSPGQVM
jgi:hypothetical protein